MMKQILVTILFFTYLGLNAQKIDAPRKILNSDKFIEQESDNVSNILSLIESKNYRVALKNINHLISKNPDNDNALLYYFNSFIYNNINKYTKAINNGLIAISKDSTKYEFYREIGTALMSTEKYSEAIKYLNKAEQLYNGDEYVFASMSLSKSGINDFKGAYIEIDKAIKLNPNNEFYREYKEFLTECMKK